MIIGHLAPPPKPPKKPWFVWPKIELPRVHWNYDVKETYAVIAMVVLFGMLQAFIVREMWNNILWGLCLLLLNLLAIITLLVMAK